MHYGISQVILKELGPAESLVKLREIGFEYVEIHSAYLDPRFTSGERFEGLVRALSESGIVAAQAHLPFWSGIDIGNYNDIIRTYGMNVTREAVERCGELGKPRLVLHPGTWQGSADAGVVGIFRELVIDAVREIAQLAAGHSLTVAVENMLGNGPEDGRRRFGAPIEDLIQIAEAVPGVKACLDTGHAFFNGQDPAECVRKLAAAGILAAMHVQDTDCFPHDRHWLPGKGAIDWPAFVAAVQETHYEREGGAFILEVSPRYGDAVGIATEALALREKLGVN